MTGRATLTRRGLIGATLSVPLAAPALRPAPAQAATRIALLHMNDFHSKHDGVSQSGASCRDAASCLGGAARLAGAVREARAAAAAEGQDGASALRSSTRARRRRNAPAC